MYFKQHKQERIYLLHDILSITICYLGNSEILLQQLIYMDKDKLEQELLSYKIREGPLLKRSKFLKQWRQRWVVLTMNYIITFTNKKCQQITDIMDLRTVKSYKSYVSKLQQMIPASFKLRSGDSSFYLCAKNVEQKWSWIVSIERLIDYKEGGPSAYNTLSGIKNKGFPSQEQYLYHRGQNLTNTGITQQLKTVEKKKEDLEKESVEIAKKIYKQKQQIEKERQKLKNQYKELINFRQTLQAEQVTRLSVEEIDKLRLRSPSVSPPQKLAEQQVSGEFPTTIKSQIITGIFEQLKPDSDQFFGFKYYMDFLINICSDTRLHYKEALISNCRDHKNNKNFGKILVEFFSEYEPTIMNSYDGRSSTQVFSISLLSKQMEYFENWMKMINLLLQEGTSIFSEEHYKKMAQKLQKFLFHEQSDSTQDVKVLLEAIHKINKYQKLNKAEIQARLTKIMKLSKKEEISNLAKTILNQL